MNKITFEKIVEANKTIKPMAIERYDKKTGKNIKKDYAEVNQRVKAFRMLYPDGFIMTDIISHENGIIVMQAKAGYYSENGDAFILGTGTAFENQKNGMINGTSYIENCETSAIGRALGMCGLGVDMSIASYEEVKNAMDIQNAPEQPQKAQIARPASKNEFTCANCGNAFSDAVTAEKSMQRWGKHICLDCIKKKQAETKRKQALAEAKKQAEEAQAQAQTLPDEEMVLPFEIK